MCGIIASFGRIPITEQKWEQALQSLVHRGPDDEGSYVSRDKRVRLGHRRLSIMDLEGGHQPLGNEDGSIWAVVNGEFYDEIELRGQLIAKGHVFQTHSDSELLVHLYEEYGVECLSYLNGEFAFILWDEKQQILFAARDRFGIKPLYFARKQGGVIFASESKALFALGVQPSLSETTLMHIFTHQYPLSNQSLFERVEQLPPAHFLMIQDSSLKIQSYWDISFSDVKLQGSESEISEQFDQLLEKAVKRRLRTEVPKAVYLSGGIDSATILALASQHEGNGRIPCYGVQFEVADYDESELAKQIATHCGQEYTPVLVTQEDILTHLEDAVWYGESLAINGQLPAKFILSQRVNQEGIKVILSGEGADEALMGYPHLKQDWLDGLSIEEQAGYQKQLQQENQLSKGVLLPQSGSSDLPTFLQAKTGFGRILHSWLSEAALEKINRYRPVERIFEYFDSAPAEKLSKATYLWTKLALANYILRGIGDGMEMSHSIEGRPPFLDHELFEFCTKLPISFKIHQGREKYILRETMRNRLPEWLIQRPKHPFLAPPVSLFGSKRGDELLQSVLRSSVLSEIPFVQPKKVHQFLDRFALMDTAQKGMMEPPLMLLLSACLLQKRLHL